MLRVLLERNDSNEFATIGVLSSGKGRPLYTLEPPWRNNERNISCIPEGEYEVVGHVSPKFGKCYLIKNVPGRDEILFHIGNFPKQTRGCILIGELKGENSVLYSRIGIKRMMKELSWPNSFTLQISNNGSI